MRINVDVLAELINVSPGEIVWAIKSDNMLEGLELPPSQRGIKNVRYKGPNSLTFEVTAAMKFAEEGVSLDIENYCTLRLLFNQSLVLDKVPEYGKPAKCCSP